MTFRPLKNAVVVRLHADPPRQVGLIYVPDSAQYEAGDFQKATVLAVGNGRPVATVNCPSCDTPMTCPACGHEQPERAKMDLEPGDVVLLDRRLSKSGFMELHEIDGDKVYLLPEGHIFVKMEKAAAA